MSELTEAEKVELAMRWAMSRHFDETQSPTALIANVLKEFVDELKYLNQGGMMSDEKDLEKARER